MAAAPGRSPVLQAFVEGFVERDATLKGLSRCDWPDVTVPDVYRSDAGSEVARAHRLVDQCVREWTLWGLRRFRGTAVDEAREDVKRAPAITGQDSAQEAKSWLHAAAGLLDGTACQIVVCARLAAARAVGIDAQSPAPPDLEAAVDAARAAGEALATASCAPTDREAGYTAVSAVLEALR